MAKEYIEREALIRKIKCFSANVIFRVEWTKGYEQGVKDTANLIAGQPAADVVEVKHGRWLDNIDENGFLRNAWRKCSACGVLNFSKRPPYCPNCGARMDGDTND